MISAAAVFAVLAAWPVRKVAALDKAETREVVCDAIVDTCRMVLDLAPPPCQESVPFGEYAKELEKTCGDGKEIAHPRMCDTYERIRDARVGECNRSQTTFEMRKKMFQAMFCNSGCGSKRPVSPSSVGYYSVWTDGSCVLDFADLVLGVAHIDYYEIVLSPKSVSCRDLAFQIASSGDHFAELIDHPFSYRISQTENHFCPKIGGAFSDVHDHALGTAWFAGRELEQIGVDGLKNSEVFNRFNAEMLSKLREAALAEAAAIHLLFDAFLSVAQTIYFDDYFQASPTVAKLRAIKNAELGTHLIRNLDGDEMRTMSSSTSIAAADLRTTRAIGAVLRYSLRQFVLNFVAQSRADSAAPLHLLPRCSVPIVQQDIVHAGAFALTAGIALTDASHSPATGIFEMMGSYYYPLSQNVYLRGGIGASLILPALTVDEVANSVARPVQARAITVEAALGAVSESRSNSSLGLELTAFRVNVFHLNNRAAIFDGGELAMTYSTGSIVVTSGSFGVGLRSSALGDHSLKFAAVARLGAGYRW